MAIHFQFIYIMLPMLSVCRSGGQLIDVRLVDGSTNTGTVMYTKDCQKWETTCGINLGISDVIVICRQLGFAGGNRAIQTSPFQGNYEAPQTYTACSGDEDNISGCPLHITRCTSNQTGAAVCYESNYLGCFVDKMGDRVLRGPSEPSYGNLTIDKCLAFCGMTSGIVFAGVENSNECYCGDASSNYSRHGNVSDSNCHAACSGSTNESCGASGYIAIFNVTANRSSTRSPVVSPCDINNTQPTTTTQRSAISSTGKTSTSNIPQPTSSRVSITKATTESVTMSPVVQTSTPSPSPPLPSSTTALFAAVGGGVAGAAVLFIVIITVVYIWKGRAKDDQRHGLDLKDIAPAGTAAPIGYENAIGNFRDTSGVDALHMDMNDDQQGEIEKDAFTAQMKRGTMLVEYANMKVRQSSGGLEPEASLHVSYENMRDDSADESAVTSKTEQDIDGLYAVSTKRRPEPDGGEQAMDAGSLYAMPEKNRKSKLSHQGPMQPLPDASAEDAGILYAMPEKNRKSKLSQSVPVLPLPDNVDTMYAMPNKPRFGRINGDTTEMVENELYG